MKIDVTNAELDILFEALHDLRKVKAAAMAAVNAELERAALSPTPPPRSDAGKFLPRDFAIPQIEALIAKLDDAELDDEDVVDEDERAGQAQNLTRGKP